MGMSLPVLWDRLRSSYWFIPSIMAVGAMVLAVALTTLDEWLGTGWLESAAWLHVNRPEGARTLLATVAGSMISVAGVTFSITIAAVSYASGQYGPRLLTNFMRDTGNQVTLGTFVATFLYGLLVLRTVRSADEGAGGTFVPHISLLVAVGSALASIGVFIYFVHHATERIHISNVVSQVGRALGEGVDELFPEPIGEPAEDEGRPAGGALPADFDDRAVAVRASGVGYLQHIDGDALLEIAKRHDLVMRLERRPGEFISRGKPLLLAYPSDRVASDTAANLESAFEWGWQRTPVQDVRFLADELVEIAARALSPGVNDPFTAVTCLDWLGAALGRVAGGRPPSGARHDGSGALRVLAEAESFETFAEAAFGQLRPYVRVDRNAALHTLRVMGEIAPSAGPAERETLRRHADMLLEGCETGLGQEADRAEVRERHRVLTDTLSAS
jgi:uncharacterized membrane protein